MKRFTSMLAAATMAALGFTGTPAHAATLIQPGVAIHLGGSGCTLNWIYDGSNGVTYAGTARHCTTGVAGQDVYVATGNTIGGNSVHLGKVAYVSAALDYSLIQVDAANLPNVSPALKGHPAIPTGVSYSQNAGDVIQFSGYGVVVDLTNATQESRVGVLAYNDLTQHYVDGLVTPGDSGGPVADVTDGNKALGIVDTLGVEVGSGIASVGEGGVSLPALLADAAANFVTISLRTV